jgi:plastocyanin
MMVRRIGHRRVFPSLLGLAVVLLTPLSSPRGESGGGADSAAPTNAGSLEGSVTLGPELNSRRIRFSLYPDVQPPPAPPSPALRAEAANVVIYLESPSLAESAAVRSTVPRRMEQVDQSFAPHVLPILKGTTVEFPNSDTIYHNVFSLSRTASFDLGRYPRGSSRSVRFDDPGLVKVFCHIHAEMSAAILVLDNPYFTTPDPAGRYAILGIPPGDYTVTAWHERARPIRRRVTIAAGRATSMDFAIPLREQPEGE